MMVKRALAGSSAEKQSAARSARRAPTEWRTALRAARRSAATECRYRSRARRGRVRGEQRRRQYSRSRAHITDHGGCGSPSVSRSARFQTSSSVSGRGSVRSRDLEVEP